jgi:TolB protein
MLRKCLLLSLALIFIISLSACGGGSVEEEKEKEIAPPGRIAFWSNRDGNPEIYVIDADGSNQQRLTNNPAEDWFTPWSADGSHLAFVSKRDGNLVTGWLSHRFCI